MVRYSNKRFIIIVILIFILGLLRYSGMRDILTLEKLQQYASTMRFMVNEHYWISVFVYCLGFIAATVLFLPVTILLTILGGYLFGIVPGLFYSLCCSTLGGMIVFLSVRYLLGDMAQKRFARHAHRFKKDLEERGYSYLLMLQLLPITPTPFINVVAGLSPLSLWTFAWTAFVGMLPGSLLYVIAGQQLTYISSVQDILSWQIMLIFFALALLALLIPYALKYMGIGKTE